MPAASQEITALLFSYADRIDAGDFDGVADLFTEAEITSEGFDQAQHGRDQIRAMYEDPTRRYQDGTPRTKHVITNVTVEVDEPAGSATARSYFTVLQAVTDELALQPIIAGRYHDRSWRPEGAWPFHGRHMLVDLIGDLGHHLLFELSPEDRSAAT